MSSSAIGKGLPPQPSMLANVMKKSEQDTSSKAAGADNQPTKNLSGKPTRLGENGGKLDTTEGRE